MIRSGISIHRINQFDQILLLSLPRNQFIILAKDQRFVPFIIFLVQLLTTLNYLFEIQLWILYNLAHTLKIHKRKRQYTKKLESCAIKSK